MRQHRMVGYRCEAGTGIREIKKILGRLGEIKYNRTKYKEVK